MTRGGSQDDPVQLLRDLQDSLEREADLREQLRFAEEEVRKYFYWIKSNFIIFTLFSLFVIENCQKWVDPTALKKIKL